MTDFQCILIGGLIGYCIGMLGVSLLVLWVDKKGRR